MAVRDRLPSDRLCRIVARRCAALDDRLVRGYGNVFDRQPAVGRGCGRSAAGALLPGLHAWPGSGGIGYRGHLVARRASAFGEGRASAGDLTKWRRGWPDAHTSGPHSGLVPRGHLGRVLRVWAVVLRTGSAGPGRRSGEILAAGDELAWHAGVCDRRRAYRCASTNTSDRLALPGGGTRLPDLHARRRDRDLLLVGGCAAGRADCVAAALGIDTVECLRWSAAAHYAAVPRRPAPVASLARGRVA